MVSSGPYTCLLKVAKKFSTKGKSKRYAVLQLCPIFCCEAVFCRLFQSISCLHLTLHPYLIESRYDQVCRSRFIRILHRQVFKFYHFPFLVVFQHNCHLLKFECQPLNWARLRIIADSDCYLYQSSCFGLRQSPVPISCQAFIGFLLMSLSYLKGLFIPLW